MNRSRPALIVFCREPIPHLAKTRLIGRLTADGAARLADAFIIDALAKAVSVRASRVVIAGSAPEGGANSKFFRSLARRFGAALIDQGRGSLGARMSRALEPFASSGALLIGTDTPSLPVPLLEKSLGALLRSRVVIAPSLDGGYYAVGVRGAMPPIFTAIRWGSGGVLDATIRRLDCARIRYTLGPAWYDVDRWSDVMLLAAHLGLRRAEHRPSRAPCPATEAVLKRLGLLPHAR
jgi:rSAM/selenodomain-associated transferase 1